MRNKVYTLLHAAYIVIQCIREKELCLILCSEFVFTYKKTQETKFLLPTPSFIVLFLNNYFFYHIIQITHWSIKHNNSKTNRYKYRYQTDWFRIDKTSASPNMEVTHQRLGIQPDTLPYYNTSIICSSVRRYKQKTI